MGFTIRCLRVKNKLKPLSTRCKKGVDNGNGLLCKDCYAEAQHTTIPILMHNDVTKKLHIPYKNQLFVEINLGKDPKKPEQKNSKERQIKEIKGILNQELSRLSVEELGEYCKDLKLDILDDMKKVHKNEYSLRYHLVKEIITRFINNSLL